jgi:hypothetical protein
LISANSETIAIDLRSSVGLPVVSNLLSNYQDRAAPPRETAQEALNDSNLRVCHDHGLARTPIAGMHTATAPRTSPNRALTRCIALVGVFGLLIANWLSPVGLRTGSSNFDCLIFFAATAAIPILLSQVARGLNSAARWLFWILALFLVLFAALAGLINVPITIEMVRRGFEVQPLLTTASRGSERVAAYQVETSPAGGYVRLRLERPILPGLVLARDVAYVDEPYIGELVVLSPSTLCVTFSTDQPDLAGHDQEFEYRLDLGSLLSWKHPPRIDGTPPATPASEQCSAGR